MEQYNHLIAFHLNGKNRWEFSDKWNSTITWSLSTWMETPVRIFRQMEQYNHLIAFHLCGKTGENYPINGTVQSLDRFPLEWKNRWEFSDKWNSTITWSLSTWMEKPVRIFRQMEQYNHLITFHLYGNTGENFPPNGTVQSLDRFPLVWKNRWELSDKWNSTITWSLSTWMEKTGENYPINGTVQSLDRFPLVWKNRWELSDKWNSTITWSLSTCVEKPVRIIR